MDAIVGALAAVVGFLGSLAGALVRGAGGAVGAIGGAFVSLAQWGARAIETGGRNALALGVLAVASGAGVYGLRRLRRR